MVDDEPEQIKTPGADLDNYVFEQVNDGFYFWNKQTKGKMERPLDASNYLPLTDCPWKLAESPEEYGELEKLWFEVKTFIQDHVFLPDERLYDILTAWVLASWQRERWNVIPYLLIKGPMSSGKTRLLETLEAISYRGIFSSNMTSAALFRLTELHKPTLFLDETEIYNKEEYSDVTHLLNAGYRRGQKAWRVEHDRDGQPYVRGYEVFGFKALSGTQELANTLQSRSIIIDMVKNIKRVNFRVNEKRAVKLRNRLLQYRFNQLSSMKPEDYGDEIDEIDDFERILPPLQEIANLGDGRLLELFCSLILVSNAGTDNIVSYAKTLNENRQGEEQTSLQFQCLDALVKCRTIVEEGKILVKSIKDKLNEGLDDKEKFTTHFVTKILSGLGFKKTHLKKGVGIVWNDTMLNYRIQQYRMEVDEALPTTPTTPVESSKSSKSSPSDIGVPFFEHCYFCQNPIMTDDWTADEFTANKPAHKECYEKQKMMVKS